MREAPGIRVSVCYAEPDHAFNVEFALPRGSTVADAIERSGIRTARPDIEVRDDRVGVFARMMPMSARLRDGDRVEIYRPLRIDPKEARRRRAKRSGRGESVQSANERE